MKTAANLARYVPHAKICLLSSSDTEVTTEFCLHHRTWQNNVYLADDFFTRGMMMLKFGEQSDFTSEVTNPILLFSSARKFTTLVSYAEVADYRLPK